MLMGEGSARSVVSRSQVDSIPFHHFVTLGARRKSGPNTREERVGQMREEIGQPCPCKDLVLEMASVVLHLAIRWSSNDNTERCTQSPSSAMNMCWTPYEGYPHDIKWNSAQSCAPSSMPEHPDPGIYHGMGHSVVSLVPKGSVGISGDCG